jgi:hypothetical protein
MLRGPRMSGLGQPMNSPLEFRPITDLDRPLRCRSAAFRKRTIKNYLESPIGGTATVGFVAQIALMACFP